MNQLKRIYKVRTVIGLLVLSIVSLYFSVSSINAQEASLNKSSTIKIIDLSNMTSRPPANEPRQEESQETGVLADSVADPVIVIRGATHKEYDRLVIEWPKGRPGSEWKELKEGDYVLSFEKGGEIKISPQRLSAFLSLIESLDIHKKDPLTLSIKSAGPLQFIEKSYGNKTVLDLYKKKTSPDSSRSEKSEQKDQDIASKALASPSPAKDLSFENETSLTKQTEVEMQPKPDLGSVVEAVNTIKETILAQEERRKSVEEIQQKNLNNSVLKESETKLQAGDVVSLSSLNPTQISVFIRAGHLWIVQSDQREGDVPALLRKTRSVQPKRIVDTAREAEAWIFPVENNLHAKVISNDLSWDIELIGQMSPGLSVPITIGAIDYQNTKIEAISFFTPTQGPILEFTDPFVGDQILTVPQSSADARGIYQKELIQIDLLKSYVGISFAPLARGLQAFYQDNALRVVLPDGLIYFSHEQKNNQLKKEDNKKPIKRIFRVEDWIITSRDEFDTNRRMLEEVIASTKDQQKTAATIRLAKLFLSQGFAYEALGLMSLLEKDHPELARNQVFAALEGVAYALGGRALEASESFERANLDNEPEVKLWQGYNLARQEKWKEAYDLFTQTGDLVLSYPEPLQSMLVTYMTKSSIESKDSLNSQALLQVLQKRPETERDKSDEAAMRYLEARLALLNNDVKKAEKLLIREAQGPDRFYRARAALDLLNIKVENKDMTNEEAIDVLDRLRYVWRGDDFEVAVMERLGELYIANNDYRRGLKAWRDIIGLLEEDQEKTEKITAKLSSGFTDLFINGKADEMSPLTALALYNEFSELTPLGEEGDAAIQKLAERMVNVDLLDNAAKLLEHQIRYRLKGEDALRVSTRLAAVYLLDNNPKQALQTLKDTDKFLTKENNAAMYKEQRDLLRARAFSEDNEPDKAIDILVGMNNEAAHRLNIDVLWRAGRWAAAAEVITPLLDFIVERESFANEEGKIETINDDAAHLILNKAVAHTLAGELGAVREIYRTYGEAMRQSKQAALFELIARAPKPGELADLQTIQSYIKEVDLFSEFLESYRSQESISTKDVEKEG